LLIADLMRPRRTTTHENKVRAAFPRVYLFRPRLILENRAIRTMVESLHPAKAPEPLNPTALILGRTGG
jgi:hypothetical protein